MSMLLWGAGWACFCAGQFPIAIGFWVWAALVSFHEDTDEL